MFWILFAVFIVSTVLSYILAPKPQINNNPGMQSFASPSSDCNRVVPEVFGTVLINGNCIYYGGYWSYPITQSMGKGSDQTIGYSYFASFAYGIATTLDAILEVRRTSQLIYPHIMWDDNGNEIYIAANWQKITANGQIASMQTGVTSRVGGSGYGLMNVTFYLGTQTAPDPALSGAVGGQAFIGTSYALFFFDFIGDNVQQIPQYSFVVQRLNILGTIGGYNFASVQVLNQNAQLAGQLVGNINQIAIMEACIANYADVNPINVLLYILINFLSISQSSIDITSFWNAANTVYNEGIGVSFQMDNSNDVKKWIQEMLQIVDGVLFFNTQNGLYTLKLIRGGYSTSGLVSISDNNCESVKFSRKTAENLPQAITITYTEKFSFQGTSATVYNTSLNMMSTQIQQQSYDFPAIACDNTAQVVLSRLIAKTTYPYASVTIVISRIAFESLNVGDVFLFNSTKLGISNMCCRVMNISNENQYDQKITIEAIEDIFNTVNTTFTPIAQRDTFPATVIPVTPSPLLHVLVYDAFAEMANSPSIFVAYAPPANADTVNISINGTQIGSQGANDYGYGVTASTFNATNVTANKNEIDYTNTLTITAASAQNLVTTAATNAQLQRLTYNAFIVDTNGFIEMFAFQNCTQNADGSWTLSGLIRGLMNTTIQSHAANSQVWVYWNNGNLIPTYSFTPVSTVNVSLTPTNLYGAGNIYTTTYSYKYLEQTPYPVSNLTGTRASGVTTLTWQTAIRLNGANYRDPDSFAAGEVASEGNVQITCAQGTFTVPAGVGLQTWTINAANSDTYSIKVILNGYVSATKTITV